jgi:hypothetical protein
MNTENIVMTTDNKRTVLVRNTALEFLTAVLIFLGLMGYITYQNLALYEERAAFSAQTQAHELAEEINDSLNQVNLSLATVVYEVERQIDEGNDNRTLNAFIANQKKHIPMLATLRYVDAKGEEMYGTDLNPNMITVIADRNYYNALRVNPNLGLYISEPMPGVIENERAIVLARRVNKADGSFGGIVYGSISLSHFNELLSQLDVGSHGTVAVLDDKDRLFDLFPRPKDLYSLLGAQNPEDSAIRQRIQALPKNGIYHSGSDSDHTSRIYAYSPVRDHPFYVLVGVAKDDYLVGWKKGLVWTLSLSGLFVLCTLAFSVFIYRQLYAQK